ncbi:hypothetical protein ANCDUO_09935 [Ancylostoma duodenale]|uniref:Uncharacterized protein n=1 Tax=Ancylostoma duodenale TaxID=51022 RepID=A0A0C2GS50_9BILA|nr:hypothetical protein ANCDUO_09935 [Ancylostoma duodenale]
MLRCISSGECLKNEVQYVMRHSKTIGCKCRQPCSIYEGWLFGAYVYSRRKTSADSRCIHSFDSLENPGELLTAVSKECSMCRPIANQGPKDACTWKLNVGYISEEWIHRP